MGDVSWVGEISIADWDAEAEVPAEAEWPLIMPLDARKPFILVRISATLLPS